MVSVEVHAQTNGNELPESLKVGSELVDVNNGFAIRIDQPDLYWQAIRNSNKFTKYVGANQRQYSLYIVNVDKEYHAEFTSQSIESFTKEYKFDIMQDWNVTKMTWKPVKPGAAMAYRFAAELTGFWDHKPAFAVGYVRSSDKLYLVQCIAPMVDEKKCRAFADSFRLLR